MDGWAHFRASAEVGPAGLEPATSWFVARRSCGGQQSRARARFKRASGRGGRPFTRRPAADTGVRISLRDAGKDLSAGRSKEAITVLEQLLQKNPKHAVALELLRQWKVR